MGQGQALPPGFVGIGGIVIAQRLFNLHRQRVLSLDAIGVIRVHGPQQDTQSIQRAWLVLAGKLVGATDQVMRLFQQTTQPMLARKQWLHLRGIVK